MNRKRFLCLGAIVIGLAFAPCAAPAGDETASRPLPLPSLQVLDRVKIDSGPTAIIYDRVAPPPLLAPAVLQAPAKAAPPERPAVIKEKESDALFLSATVYDREFTVLRWSWEGHAYQAVSNIDFNYLAGLVTIETADSVFTVLMGLGNESREQLDSQRQNGLLGIASPPPVSVPRPACWLVFPDPATPVSAAALAGIDALHRYFEANKAALVAAFDQRQADQAARERAAETAPPPPKETVIRFWPVKSRVYPVNP